MRLTILLIFLSFTHALSAQSSDKRFTLNLKNVSLKEFISQIEAHSDYRVVYGEDIRLKSPINLRVKDQVLEEVLKEAFRNQGIDYEIQTAHIILKKQSEVSKPVTSQRFTISGYISDKTTGETLIGANIYSSAGTQGTFSNEYGFYSLTLPEGETTLRYSYVGYESENLDMRLEKSIELNIKLHPNKQLNEVIVYGDKSETGISATQMGALDIPLDILKATPALLGEADLMKTVQMMPGVQAGTEGSAGIYVRGGGVDENLILLDGVPLYNVDHLFGFFSVFTPEAIKKVSLFKGSFPARFGGRLSSVIDVRTNDGDMKNYHGTIGIGLLSNKLHFEGPIIKDRTSFNISARRSYLDWLTKPFMDDDRKFGYYFYDLNAKINHRFNDRSRLFLSIYNGKDKMDTRFMNDNNEYATEDRMKLHWGNFLSALRWNYQWSPKLFSNTTVAYTHYKFNVGLKFWEKSIPENFENNYSSDYSSGIKDLAFNMDFDYHPLPNHHIKFGGGYLNHHFHPEVQSARMKSNENGIPTDSTYTSMGDSRIRAHEGNIYLEDNLTLGKRLSANLGFHLSLFQVDNKTYTSFQPRLSARYQWTDNISIKAAYTKMSQYIHLLSSYTVTMPTDLWVPATPEIKPMQAHQFSIGGYYTGFKPFELSVEAYYKNMHNVLEYKDGASFLGSSQNWENKVEMGTGRAMGIEFMLQKKTGATTGWLAYTLAKSDRKFAEDGINQGKRFPYKYDRRHHVNVVINHKFSDKIDIGASWEFYTGGTTTLAEEKTLVMIPDRQSQWSSLHELDFIENRNNFRMPSSHRLNVGINFNKKTKHGTRTWNISVYNVYNAMNPAFIYRTTVYEGEGIERSRESILKKVTILPFIPSVSYIYKF